MTELLVIPMIKKLVFGQKMANLKAINSRAGFLFLIKSGLNLLFSGVFLKFLEVNHHHLESIFGKWTQ